MEYVSSGGITASSGGRITVSAGGIVQAGLTISGGTALVSGTVAAGQTVTFAGSGGDLALANLSAFAAVISFTLANDGTGGTLVRFT